MKSTRPKKKSRTTTQAGSAAAAQPKPAFDFEKLPKELIQRTSQFFSMSDYQNGTLVSKGFYGLFHGGHFWIGMFKKHLPNYSIHRLLKIKNLDWTQAFITAYNEVYARQSATFIRMVFLVNEGNLEKIQKSWLNSIIIATEDFDLCRHAARHGHQSILDYFYQEILNCIFLEDSQIDTKGRSLLHWAIICRQPLTEIKAILRSYDFLNRRTEDNEHALLYAVKIGYTQCIEFLLQQPINIDWQGEEGTLILTAAAGHGQLAMLNMILSKKPPINPRDNRTSPPLHEAIYFKNIGAVRLLMEYGANVNALDEMGLSPLHYAKMNIECMHLLLAHGANSNIVATDQTTPLYAAVFEGEYDTASLLLKNGADPNAQIGESRYTALMGAAEFGYAKIIQLLLEHGAKVNRFSVEGESAVFFAAENGHADCLRILLKAGGYANKKIKETLYTPLVTAARHGHEECVTVLLEHKAIVNFRINGGSTALSHAAEFGHLACLRLLLQHGADPDIGFNHNTMNPIKLAARFNHIECLFLLIQYGARLNLNNDHLTFSPLNLAVNENSLACATMLINAGANPNTRNVNGHTPLYIAVVNDSFECAKLLIDCGADLSMIYEIDEYELRALVNDSHLDDKEHLTIFLDQQIDRNNIKITIRTLIQLLHRDNMAPLIETVEQQPLNKIQQFNRVRFHEADYSNSKRGTIQPS